MSDDGPLPSCQKEVLSFPSSTKFGIPLSLHPTRPTLKTLLPKNSSRCLRRSAEGASGDDGAGVLGEDLACFFIGQPLKPAAELAGAEVVSVFHVNSQ
jgi:hypothetical protein